MRTAVLALFLLTPLGACACPRGAPALPRPAAGRAPHALPRERALARAAGLGHAAVWRYLAATYDADQDGRVTAEEHGRGPEVFARLDHDQDGALTPADFRGPTPMDRLLARLFLMRHLSPPAPDAPPGPPGPPDADALARGFAAVDADGDGRLSRAEVERELARPRPHSRVPPVPRGVHLHAALRASVDADADGYLALDEWQDFVAGLARAPRPAPRPAPTGPRPGEPAPDFELPLRDGSGRVRLSEVLARRPVALLFGSWT